MAATKFTASTASGYMTNAMWDVSIGPFRCFTAHYSSPTATSQYISLGMHAIVFPYVEDADPSTLYYTANSVGGVDLYFSGNITGSTGYIFVLGF